MVDRYKSPAERERDKKRYFEFERGIRHLTDAAPTAKRISAIRGRGVTLETMVERTGISKPELRSIQWGKRAQVRTATERSVLDARFTWADVSKYPAFAVRRRLQALAARGFTTTSMGDMVGRDNRQLSAMITGRSSGDWVVASLGRAIYEAYEKYKDVEPMEIGQKSFGTKYAAGVARRNLFAPPHCWDDDTLDDPHAYPEWTGKCGQFGGVFIHVRDDIPICAKCQPIADKSQFDSAEIIRMYVEEHKTNAEIAAHYGVRKDYLSIYTASLRPDDTHALSTIDRLVGRATCSKCGPGTTVHREGVRNGHAKYVCGSYRTEKRRKDRERKRADKNREATNG